jgi:hypothetical protein
VWQASPAENKQSVAAADSRPRVRGWRAYSPAKVVAHHSHPRWAGCSWRGKTLSRTRKSPLGYVRASRGRRPGSEIRRSPSASCSSQSSASPTLGYKRHDRAAVASRRASLERCYVVRRGPRDIVLPARGRSQLRVVLSMSVRQQRPDTPRLSVRSSGSFWSLFLPVSWITMRPSKNGRDQCGDCRIGVARRH